MEIKNLKEEANGSVIIEFDMTEEEHRLILETGVVSALKAGMVNADFNGYRCIPTSYQIFKPDEKMFDPDTSVQVMIRTNMFKEAIGVVIHGTITDENLDAVKYAQDSLQKSLGK